VQGNTSIPPAQTSASPLPAQASELLIFAAAGTKAPVDEAAKLFEQRYGTKININYGGGGEVLSNMVLAKKGDIYIAPEQRFMDSAKKQGAIESTATPTSMAFMIPVIGVQKGNPQNIQSLADLSKSGLKLVMGNPETTALGIIVPQILQKASLYDTVNPNFVTNAPQIGNIITMLKMKQVDAGFIWHYFATTSSADLDVIWIPKEYVTGIGEIQAAVSAYSQESGTAEQFVKFLISPEGQDIFKKNGYIVDRQEAAKYWTANQ
jgi:molybdate transport system substrate-binding protein